MVASRAVITALLPLSCTRIPADAHAMPPRALARFCRKAAAHMNFRIFNPQPEPCTADPGNATGAFSCLFFFFFYALAHRPNLPGALSRSEKSSDLRVEGRPKECVKVTRDEERRASLPCLPSHRTIYRVSYGNHHARGVSLTGKELPGKDRFLTVNCRDSPIG